MVNLQKDLLVQRLPFRLQFRGYREVHLDRDYHGHLSYPYRPCVRQDQEDQRHQVDPTDQRVLDHLWHQEFPAGHSNLIVSEITVKFI